ncbi:MAG: hypothetical protein ACJAZO_003829 [Myxococcota bacterium]|jgi:hypothetical protein
MADTDRPSAPLLKMLREWIQTKRLNTAAAALAMGVDRTRARRVLSGAEAMTVDELLALGTLLELSPEDLALTSLAEPAPLKSTGPRVVPMEAESAEVLTVDPFGNHPEQLFRAAIALGCDFMFVVDTKGLEDSGLPKSTLEQYSERELPIKLDAAFHMHNNPSYNDVGVSLTLSFDALYTCSFPWSAFRQFIFFPVIPDAIEEEEEEAPNPNDGRPKLRLVT